MNEEIRVNSFQSVDDGFEVNSLIFFTKISCSFFFAFLFISFCAGVDVLFGFDALAGFGKADGLFTVKVDNL